MKFDIINANTDLGIHIDGARLGPKKISASLGDLKIDNIYNIDNINLDKERDVANKFKNKKEINRFNEELYNKVVKVIEKNHFPITLGGDHSIAIGSSLASIKNRNLGIIWIDSHGDFNTYETTTTGNIHGFPFACICGYKCADLRSFSKNTFDPLKAVLIGGSAIDYPYEYENLKEAGVTIISYEEIRKEGIKKSLDKAFKIALNKTSGVHISYDLDSIDPKYAPGVSTPEGVNVKRSINTNILNSNVQGFTRNEALEIIKYIKNNIDVVKSLDLVEFNPLNDENDKTLDLAKDIIEVLVGRK